MPQSILAVHNTDGFNLNTAYLIIVILATAIGLYFTIKKNREDTKKDLIETISGKVIGDTKSEVVTAVQYSVNEEVKKAIQDLDYKITQNGKNSNNLGDVAARTEEKVDELRRSLMEVAAGVKYNGDRITNHLGWHAGYEEAIDSKKKSQ